MTAAAGGNPSAVIGWVDTGTDNWTWEDNYRMSRWRFMPEFHLPWLIQRYNALNLLRYAVPVLHASGSAYTYRYEGAAGRSGSDGPFASLDTALAKAVENSHSTSGPGWMSIYLNYNYTDPSWIVWGYAASFQQVNRLSCFLPAGISNWRGYMGADFYVPDGYLAAPNCPAPGYSRIESDENGCFTLTDVFPFWSGETLPTEQNGRYGIEIDGEPRFYFDLYPQFHFKPEE